MKQWRRLCSRPFSLRWNSYCSASGGGQRRYRLWRMYLWMRPVLRIRDVYPRSWILPIPDLGSKNSNKRDGRKKKFCHTIFCSHKFTKLKIILLFEMLKKIIWANFQRIIELCKLSKLLLSSQKYEFGIRNPEKPIPDPGVKKAPDPDSQHWMRLETNIILYICKINRLDC